MLSKPRRKRHSSTTPSSLPVSNTALAAVCTSLSVCLSASWECKFPKDRNWVLFISYSSREEKSIRYHPMSSLNYLKPLSRRRACSMVEAERQQEKSDFVNSSRVKIHPWNRLPIHLPQERFEHHSVSATVLLASTLVNVPGFSAAARVSVFSLELHGVGLDFWFPEHSIL